jgi:pimeloyl-ACP methyl ester carboxylesterase
MMRVLRKRWWLILAGMIVVGSIAFIVWALAVPTPMPEAMEAIKPDYEVLVTKDRWWTFQPILTTPATGFIIYPGGRVDPRAYAPQAHAIAAHGYLVVIVRMPLNLAVLDPEQATDVIQQYPEITNWAIGGHSLGGAMAALYADKHPDAIKGLVLWASYPSSSNDLSNSTIKVTSIYASQDGLATPKKIKASRPLLPANTTWVQIKGGNHAQFGWYGPQPGDHAASISRENQQDQVIQATLDLLRSIR